MISLTKDYKIFVLSVALLLSQCYSLSVRPLSPSKFVGASLFSKSVRVYDTRNDDCMLTMRKQKASNKRTRRLQKGNKDEVTTMSYASSIATPTATASWNHKIVKNNFPSTNSEGGRGRSRKRSQLYNSLASYHSQFLKLITEEFLAEEKAVRERIDTSLGNPLSLEIAGHALFDLYPERRGNIFSDEVYRLVKAYDATSTYSSTTLVTDFDDNNESRVQNSSELGNGNSITKKDFKSVLPPNHRFSQNDVIMLTLQPGGTGDFFDRNTMPTSTDVAISIEARVLNTGPSYIDIAIPSGKFEQKFGPAPNNKSDSGKGDPRMRLRADRYFSNVPYNRMVGALSQLTSIDKNENGAFDDLIRQAILKSFGLNDPSNPLFQDQEASGLQDLVKQLSKPPLKNSAKLTKEVLTYLQQPTNTFPRFNGPQISCIGASLSRRLTMIQGPPGTGKTTVAAAIAFGFAHQCRSLSPSHKVLATAFSNCGADNLAEQLLRIGLKVIRVGKASAVSRKLWDYTLDAAIERDPMAKMAMEEAAVASANVNSKRKGGRKIKSRVDKSNERNKRELATLAVKASIEACNEAATKAMREADVIVCTSVGAADTRLLAACGLYANDDEGNPKSRQKELNFDEIRNAPDGGPPLKIPFVLIDEACQSVEPATLIPILSTNGCRSLVLLGDPCQLPPTVISDSSRDGESPLSISLMSRLATTLPAPIMVTAQVDKTPKENFYLDLKATRQAKSIIKRRSATETVSYRKQFAGSMLLTVQYRMHPSIAAFSSSIFYDGLLSTPAFLSKHRVIPTDFDNVLPIENGSTSVRVVHIGGSNNEKRGDTSSMMEIRSSNNEVSLASESIIPNESISNEAEATKIVGFLKDVLNPETESESPFEGSIGIITPYSAQVILIKSLITQDSELISLVKNRDITIEVNSVDAYQGRECDVILFSAVRSNRQSNVGFLCDWRRMNVALTRAKSGLIVFGDMTTLKAGDKHWEGFYKWAEDLGCVFDVCAVVDTE